MSDNSLMDEWLSIQKDDDGSTPILSLQNTSPKNFKVIKCNRHIIKKFIEKHHYSKSINGVKSEYCFSLHYDGMLIGAAIFSWLGMANVWKKYVKKEKDLIELRRLCCIDEAPKNTESYFIGYCLRWLKRHTDIKKVISYADPNYNHSGIIYKATNFEYLGVTKPTKVIFMDGKYWHDKTVRTYYNNELKPYAKRIKEALKSGEAVNVIRKGKHVYLKTIN